MLIIPFDRPIDWRRPPIVTFALVAANVLVFFLFQLDDGREIRAVKSHYYESGLAEIELPHYRGYLQRQGDDELLLEHFGEAIDDPNSPWFERLLGDSEFQQRLENEQVIAPGHSDYAHWRSERDRLNRGLDETTVWGHGLRPSDPRPMDFLSHMFLHGNLAHLIGNMLFLIAVGLLVEVGLGSLMMTGLYLLSGLGAAGLYMGLNPHSVIPMVGASGAIAGLMGLCGALYGLRKVRFFYFIGIYFDYVKAPAVVLLGLWLGKELWQYMQYSEVSSVAYMAHIGGILTGAAAGAAVRFGTHAVDESALDEREQNDAFRQRMGEAHEKLQAMAPERARPLFERLTRENPHNLEVLDGLLQASRFAPDSDAYHDAVRRILHLEATDEETTALKLSAYRDYRERARPKARLNAALIHRLIELLLRKGSPAEVMPLVRAGLKQPKRFPAIADQACRLAVRLQGEGHRDAARKLFRHITAHFPASEPARTAERALKSLSP
ncbi:MAG: rhomboid family intramembrane serine protease [Halofilum sp. (in: g-proteobacteria)]